MKLSWKALLVFISIFAAGMVAGGALGVRWARKPLPSRGQRPPSIEQFGKNQMNMIAQRLSLSDEQRLKVTPIFNRANEELRQLRAAGFKQTTEVFTKMDADLIGILTPEQVKKFEELRRHQRDRMRNFMQMGPPPRGEKRPERDPASAPPPPHGNP